jgi:2-dehydropantoate 2-reductase
MGAGAAGPVVVMGAGAIGCFVGGRLAAAGAEVHFVGRPRVLDALRTQGLTLTDLEAPPRHLAAAALHLHAEPPALAGALALLCVKSGATAEAAATLARVLPAGSPVLSLQNGIGNTGAAQVAAPALTCSAGMVPFNVAELGPGTYHRGTIGQLAAQDHPALRPWLPLFAAAGLPLALHADLRPVQWAKLLLNLNNPVNALSGLPLRAQLLDRDCRAVTAALQAEALAVLQRAGIEPAQITPVPPRRLPAVLRLPTWLFRIVAARSLRIDAKARSSMADDLALGRRTEVDALCGEVVRLARAHGGEAPLNARMAALVEGDPRPRSPRELRAAIGV